MFKLKTPGGEDFQRLNLAPPQKMLETKFVSSEDLRGITRKWGDTNEFT